MQLERVPHRFKPLSTGQTFHTSRELTGKCRGSGLHTSHHHHHHNHKRLSACASISLHGWGGHTVANQPPHYCPPLIHLHSPPPRRNGVWSHSRCGAVMN